MKKNLMYILTLITIVVALNYIHLHSDPYPSCHDNEDPFFACWLQETNVIKKVYTTQNSPQTLPDHASHLEEGTHLEEQTS